jgi:citrate lyase gamma subunit
MVRGAANPGSRQYGPRNGMGAKIIYPSNIDPVRGVAGLIKEFYRMSGVNIDFRVENASIIAGPPRQRCVHAVGHGLLGNNPVQPGNYWEMDALVCTTAPNQMGEYTVTLTLSDIDPKFADRLRATVAAIFMSYEVDQAVVSGQAGAIAAPAIAAIHQIGATATARMQANDRANERQHNDWNAEQDLKARQNQAFTIIFSTSP